MVDRDDCERFQQILDASLPGTVDADSLGTLKEHAASCRECDAILRVHMHLSGISESRLLNAVPEDIENGIRNKAASFVEDAETKRNGRQARSRWLDPVISSLSAAIVLLVLASVFLLAEISRLKENEQDLHSRILRQEKRLDGLELAAETISLSDDRYMNRKKGWMSAAFFKSDITVGELLRALRDLDPSETVIEPSELVFGDRPAWTMRGKHGPINVAGVDLSDGIQAEEAIRLIRTTRIDPDSRITKDTISELAAKYLSRRFDRRYM